jgi:protein-S-isoprenylcysteine O-methyltransferase Ste14
MKTMLTYLSIIGFLILVFVLSLLFTQGSCLGKGIIAITVQILSVLLMIWARVTFGMRSFHATANPTEGGLVTTGPYRFLRHPIYASIFYFISAGTLSHISVPNMILEAAAIAGILVRIITEENLLVKRYPEYFNYSSKTKRIIPFIF